MGRLKEALIDCPACDGDGHIDIPVGPGRERGFGFEPDWRTEECPHCHGARFVIDPDVLEAAKARLATCPDADHIADTHAAIQAAREEELARIAAVEKNLSRHPQAPSVQENHLPR